MFPSKTYVAKKEKIRFRYKHKKRLHRNAASFKIQYPMKNRCETNSQKPNWQVAKAKTEQMWKTLTTTGLFLVFTNILYLHLQWRGMFFKLIQ